MTRREVRHRVGLAQVERLDLGHRWAMRPQLQGGGDRGDQLLLDGAVGTTEKSPMYRATPSPVKVTAAPLVAHSITTARGVATAGSPSAVTVSSRRKCWVKTSPRRASTTLTRFPRTPLVCAPQANNSSEVTPTRAQPAPSLKPSAVASPTRSPVKSPGPRSTTTRSRSRTRSPASWSSRDRDEVSTSVWCRSSSTTQPTSKPSSVRSPNAQAGVAVSTRRVRASPTSSGTTSMVSTSSPKTDDARSPHSTRATADSSTSSPRSRSSTSPRLSTR